VYFYIYGSTGPGFDLILIAKTIEIVLSDNNAE